MGVKNGYLCSAFIAVSCKSSAWRIADHSVLSETLMVWLGTGFKGKSELPGPTFCVPECSYTSCYRFLLSYLSDVNMEELALRSWARKQVFCGM